MSSANTEPKVLGRSLIELAGQYHGDVTELAQIDAALQAFDRLPGAAMFRLSLERDEAINTSGLNFQKTRDNPLGQWPSVLIGKNLALGAYEQRRTILKVRIDDAFGKLQAAEHIVFSPRATYKP